MFTSREEEVLKLLAEGHTNPQIAERMFLSPNTVKHHVRTVFHKINVNTRTKAAVWFLNNKEHFDAKHQ